MSTETQNQITFYQQLAEHYAQQLLDSQVEIARILSSVPDKGTTLYHYLQLLRLRTESSRQLLSTLPNTPDHLLNDAHRYYSTQLALIEQLEKVYSDILPDEVIELTVPSPTE